MNKTSKIEKVGMGKGGGHGLARGKTYFFLLLFFHHKCRAASGRKGKKHICFFFFFPSSMQSCLSLIAHHIDPLPSSPHTFYIGSYLVFILSSSLSSCFLLSFFVVPLAIFSHMIHHCNISGQYHFTKI